MEKDNKPETTVYQPKKRIDSLQALRAFAFLGVFAFHTALGEYGSWAVSVFMVLSGFLMVYSYYDRDTNCSFADNLKFSAQKTSPLYPLHIIMTVAILYVIATAGGAPFSFNVFNLYKREILLNIFLVQSWVPNPNIYFALNGVAWYLAVCVFVYFMFPWLLKAIKSYKNIFTAVTVTAAVYVTMTVLAAASFFAPLPADIFPNPPVWFTYVCPLFRMGDFFIGCNLGYLFLKLPYKLSAVWATVAELFTFVALCITQFIHEEQIIYIGGEWFRHNLLYIPSSMMLVWVFAHSKGYITRLLTNKVTVWLGNISAYGFLIHAVVYLWVRNLVKTTAFSGNVKLMALIAFVVTIAMSLVYRKAEKAVKKLLQNK